MSNSDKTLHAYFMQSTLLLSKMSKCVSFKVAAQVVKDKRIISMGYNGTPVGMPNCCDIFNETSFDRDKHHTWSNDHEIHAEMNALMFTAKENISVDGATMYVTHHPCNQCLKNMIQAGIKQVYFYFDYDKSNPNGELLKYIKVTKFNEDLSNFIESNNLNFGCTHVVPTSINIETDKKTEDFSWNLEVSVTKEKTKCDNHTNAYYKPLPVIVADMRNPEQKYDVIAVERNEDMSCTATLYRADYPYGYMKKIFKPDNVANLRVEYVLIVPRHHENKITKDKNYITLGYNYKGAIKYYRNGDKKEATISDFMQ